MNIQINQLGYTPAMRKIAVMHGKLSDSLRIMDADGNTVLTLPVTAERIDIWGDQVAQADFSALTTPGTYTLHCGEESSWPFPIADAPYHPCLTALVDMFYYQRCGGEVDARAGIFAHPACHATPARVYGTEEFRDVNGGWHDAGDFGRYIVPAAKAVADLLLAWQWNPAAFAAPGLTPLLEEARWELEWMLKMQREDGGVYHKVTCSNFPGEVMPQDETDPLIIMPVSTTATGDFAGVMAIAARVYADIDKAYAETCLAAAKKAAEYLDKTPSDKIGYKNPSDIATGEYEDAYDLDERYWAYAELYKTTGDKAYEKSMSEWIPNNGLSLGWQGVAGYGAYAYLSSKDVDKDLFDRFKNSANNLAEVLDKKTNMYPYGSSIIGDYPWGSNLTIANNGVLVLMLKNYVDLDKTIADKQLNYLFGNNSTGYCFFTEFGTTYSDHPHHRPSQALGKTVPGMVVGGPSNVLGDPYAANVLKGVPAARCYVDNAQSYSTNEITIYWNSPLIYLLAGEIAETK